MQEKLIEFLKLLEAAIPPPEKCHHAFMYAQFGSDEAGWTDKLLLQVNVKGRFYPFFLDDEEWDKESSDIVNSIVESLSQPPPKNWQVSEILGQAGPNPIEGQLRT